MAALPPTLVPHRPPARHREARRHVVEVTGRLRLPELLDWVAIDVTNISVAGAFLRTRMLLDLGARFAVEIPLPDGSRYRGHAEVVRHVLEGETGMGVRFLHLSDLDRRRLRRILGV